MEAVEMKKVFYQISFISILIVVSVIAFLYLYNIINWRNAPDFGFGFRNATGIKIVGVVREHGLNAGCESATTFYR